MISAKEAKEVVSVYEQEKIDKAIKAAEEASERTRVLRKKWEEEDYPLLLVKIDKEVYQAASQGQNKVKVEIGNEEYGSYLYSLIYPALTKLGYGVEDKSYDTECCAWDALSHTSHWVYVVEVSWE